MALRIKITCFCYCVLKYGLSSGFDKHVSGRVVKQWLSFWLDNTVQVVVVITIYDNTFLVLLSNSGCPQALTTCLLSCCQTVAALRLYDNTFLVLFSNNGWVVIRLYDNTFVVGTATKVIITLYDNMFVAKHWLSSSSMTTRLLPCFQTVVWQHVCCRLGTRAAQRL